MANILLSYFALQALMEEEEPKKKKRGAKPAPALVLRETPKAEDCFVGYTKSAGVSPQLPFMYMYTQTWTYDQLKVVNCPLQLKVTNVPTIEIVGGGERGHITFKLETTLSGINRGNIDSWPKPVTHNDSTILLNGAFERGDVKGYPAHESFPDRSCVAQVLRVTVSNGFHGTLSFGNGINFFCDGVSSPLLSLFVRHWKFNDKVSIRDSNLRNILVSASSEKIQLEDVNAISSIVLGNVQFGGSITMKNVRGSPMVAGNGDDPNGKPHNVKGRHVKWLWRYQTFGQTKGWTVEEHIPEDAEYEDLEEEEEYVVEPDGKTAASAFTLDD